MDMTAYTSFLQTLHYLVYVHVFLLFSFSVAALLSFLDSVYASLLVDLGSTFNKTLSTGMVRAFAIAGYLKLMIVTVLVDGGN